MLIRLTNRSPKYKKMITNVFQTQSGMERTIPQLVLQYIACCLILQSVITFYWATNQILRNLPFYLMGTNGPF